MNKVILDKIDELQAVIDKHGVLDAELQKKINYKFRLDWNFYSNEMEGNSLTRIETRQLMMENVTIDGKPFKDVIEMRGHDKEVLEIMRVGKGEVRLSESRIKAMHRAIMYETNPEKESLIGNWKPVNNYLINYKGEKFEFLPPEEVADAMHKLLNQTNAHIDAINASKKEAIHPIELAFQFHLEYIRIHPFYDGNGRTARLLTNLLLISTGFPPVILRKKDRDLYYKYLADIQGYGANPDLFLGFMADLVINSQQMVLEAIDGKDIDDENDLDKEIALWKNELDHSVTYKSNPVIVEIYKQSIKPFIELLIEKQKQFNDLFIRKNTICYFNDRRTFGLDESFLDVSKFSDFIEKRQEEVEKIIIEFIFGSFTKNGENNFNFSSQLALVFEDLHYKIAFITDSNNNSQDIITRLYTQNLTEQEIKNSVQSCMKYSFEEIKRLKDPNSF